MVQRIGLVEALCGFQMTVTHLDGRQLLVKYPPGKIIEPGEHRGGLNYRFPPMSSDQPTPPLMEGAIERKS